MRKLWKGAVLGGAVTELCGRCIRGRLGELGEIGIGRKGADGENRERQRNDHAQNDHSIPPAGSNAQANLYQQTTCLDVRFCTIAADS